jgi:hypothetical protein
MSAVEFTGDAICGLDCSKIEGIDLFDIFAAIISPI